MIIRASLRLLIRVAFLATSLLVCSGSWAKNLRTRAGQYTLSPRSSFKRTRVFIRRIKRRTASITGRTLRKRSILSTI